MVSATDGRLRRSAASRLEILEAAEVEFATRGFTQTSIRTVALAVGMSAPGVARHFADKKALFAEMLLRISERNLAGLTSSLGAQVDPAERLSRMVARLVAKPTEAILYTTMLGDGRHPGHPAHRYVTRFVEGVREPFAEMFGPDSSAIHAGWEGVRLLWLYLPERVDPAAALGARVAQCSQGAGSRDVAAADVSPEPGVAAPPVDLPAGSAAVPAGSPAASPVAWPAPTGSDLDDRIIAAAGRAFAQHGYQGARIRAIAAAVGISHTTLIYHFPNKEALLRGVLGHGQSRPEFDVDGLAFVRALYLRKFSGGVSEDLAHTRSALAFEAIDAGHPAHHFFVERFDRVLDRFEGLYAELAEAELLLPGLDPRLEAVWTLALWEGLRIQSYYRPDLDEPELTRLELNRSLVPSARLSRASTS